MKPAPQIATIEAEQMAGQMMMTASDRQKHLKEEARRRAVEESPLQNYAHEINHPFHLRRNSFKIWSTKLSPKVQAKCINFDAKPAATQLSPVDAQSEVTFKKRRNTSSGLTPR